VAGLDLDLDLSLEDLALWFWPRPSPHSLGLGVLASFNKTDGNIAVTGTVSYTSVVVRLSGR